MADRWAEDAVAANDALVAALAGRDLTVMTGQEGVDLLGAAVHRDEHVERGAVGGVCRWCMSRGCGALDGSRSAAAWLARLEGGTVGDAGGDLRAAKRAA